MADFEAIFELDDTDKIDCIFDINATVYNYEELDELPQINGETLIGNKTSEELHLGSKEDVERLEQNIQNEATTRAENDTLLQNNINTLDEKVDGINVNLTTQIDNLEQDVNTKYNELINDIDEEIQAREQADTTINQRITDVADELGQQIEDNVVALQQEDTALQNQINAHSTTLTAYDTRITNNANAISQEVIDRQNADDNLQEQIDNLKARGRFLSLWNATTGLAETNPEIDPYPYNTGDYFIVGTVGETNYKPTGTQYVIGQASTVIETEELASEDVYYFDGSVWHLQVNHGKTVSFANLAGQPSDNIALKQALDSKQDVIADLSTIRTNAQAGKIASDTIATYGDIVTHNADEFATTTALTQGLATKQDVITDLDTIRANASTGAGLSTQVESNTQRIEELATSKLPNATPVGTPHIVGSYVSNFSDTSYMLFPFTDISRGYPFDIYFSFTTSSDVTTQQNILDSYFGIALAIQNNKGIMALSSNGINWDIGMSIGTNTLLPNTTYYVKYSWTGEQYNASISTNRESYIPDMSLNSTLSPHKTTIYIGGSPNLFGTGSAHPFKGTINFKDAKVVVQGIEVWDGYADVGFQTRANVSLSNLDEAGEHRFSVKQDIINDLATIRDGASKGATAYQKPSTGIPKTDLASAVQTSLGKADTAIQSTADCVKTSGNQTVTGVKTFSNAGYNTGGITINNTEVSGASSVVFKSGGVKKGIIGIDASSKPIFEDNGNTITNLVRVTRNTAVGSASVPVYIDANGIATTCNTIPSSTDFVKTSGNQTVAGVKTFSSTPVITSTALNINNTGDVSIQRAGTNFLRKASGGATVLSASKQTIYLSPNGDTDITGAASLATDGTLTATKFSGALTGNVTGNCSGSSGSCTGNAATATKATQDSAGVQINTGYSRLWNSKYAISEYSSANNYIKLATINLSNFTNYDISNLFWVEAHNAGTAKGYALCRLSVRMGGTAYSGTKFEILEKYGDNASVFDSLVWAYKYTTASSKGTLIGEIWMKIAANSWYTYYFRPTDCNEFGDYSNTTVRGNTTVWTYYDKNGTSANIASTAITSGYTQVAITDLSKRADKDGNGNNIVNTYATKAYANTASFPSKTQVGYVVGASGASYTASDNGWLYINGNCTGTVAYVLLINVTSDIRTICWNNATAGNANCCYIPVNKGDTFQIHYYQFSPQQCWITKINGEV